MTRCPREVHDEPETPPKVEGKRTVHVASEGVVTEPKGNGTVATKYVASKGVIAELAGAVASLQEKSTAMQAVARSEREEKQAG